MLRFASLADVLVLLVREMLLPCYPSIFNHCFDGACTGGGGGSSIVKVPGDVPPARVCFFKPSILAKGILFANFRPFSLGKGILFGNFGQRNVKLR